MVIVLHGDIYELSTWHTMLKVLFSKFVLEDIQYNYTTDFNGTGEFQSVLTHDLQTRSKKLRIVVLLRTKQNLIIMVTTRFVLQLIKPC